MFSNSHYRNLTASPARRRPSASRWLVWPAPWLGNRASAVFLCRWSAGQISAGGSSGPLSGRASERLRRVWPAFSLGKRLVCHFFSLVRFVRRYWRFLPESPHLSGGSHRAGLISFKKKEQTLESSFSAVSKPILQVTRHLATLFEINETCALLRKYTFNVLAKH